MTSNRFCNCYTCRKVRKTKGTVLGTRLVGYFSNGVFGFSKVSDYVRHHKFQPGRRLISKFNATEVLKEY